MRSAVSGAVAAPGSTAPLYEVTYPNAVVVTFPQKWQAAQATALSGGTMKVLQPTPGSETDTPGGGG